MRAYHRRPRGQKAKDSADRGTGMDGGDPAAGPVDRSGVHDRDRHAEFPRNTTTALIRRARRRARALSNDAKWFSPRVGVSNPYRLSGPAAHSRKSRAGSLSRRT